MDYQLKNQNIATMTHRNPYPRKQKGKEGKFPIKEKAKRKRRKISNQRESKKEKKGNT